jgi:uncharacterized protein YdeI (YjbR/CyaY-like superfamily)
VRGLPGPAGRDSIAAPSGGPKPSYFPAGLADWRAWLRKHHRSEPFVWLVFRKGDKSGLSYADALDEALAWGWIDSIVRRIDDRFYVRKFTPRRDSSNWSAVNRRHLVRLEREGRMQAAGLAVAPTEGEGAVRRKRPAAPAEPVPELLEALDGNAKAKAFFEALAPSYRRRYTGWVGMAKSPGTRQRRAAEAVELLARGVKSLLK